MWRKRNMKLLNHIFRLKSHTTFSTPLVHVKGQSQQWVAVIMQFWLTSYSNSHSVTNIPAHALIICLHLKKLPKIDQYKGFVIASLFPGFASPSILMANLLFLQSSKCSCRPREPELHPLFISAGGSQGWMNQSRALGGRSAGWSNWRRPWAKTSLYVLHRLGLPRVKIVGEKRVWILERSPCSVTLEPTATVKTA